MSPRRLTVVAAVGLVALGIAGCSSSGYSALEASVPQTVEFDNVVDDQNSDYYSVRSTASGETTEVGTELTLGFDVTNTNDIKIRPVATITYADGSEMVCANDDSRRHASLVESLDTWDFPCPEPFPEDTAGAVVTVTEP